MTRHPKYPGGRHRRNKVILFLPPADNDGFPQRFISDDPSGVSVSAVFVCSFFFLFSCSFPFCGRCRLLPELLSALSVQRTIPFEDCLKNKWKAGRLFSFFCRYLFGLFFSGVPWSYLFVNSCHRKLTVRQEPAGFPRREAKWKGERRTYLNKKSILCRVAVKLCLFACSKGVLV